MKLALPLSIAWVVLVQEGWADESHVDVTLPYYVPEAGLKGTLNSIGSDTLNNLMTLWGEGVRRHHPGVLIRK